jgi:predicted nucleotide-binding protein (sugar kinase/HSP70/actin superfamily)
MPSIAIPNLGNYSIAFASLVRPMGVEAWTCTRSSAETMALGVAAAPETACVPFKMYLGHFLKAMHEGVDYAVMVNSLGACRLKYYAVLMQKILADHGSKIHFFSLGYDGIKPPLIRHFDPSIPTFLRCFARYCQKIRAVDEIERAAWYTRPRETRCGSTTRLMDACLVNLNEAETVGDIRAVRGSLDERFAAVETDPTRHILKVGLIGEAAVLRDKYVNHDMEGTLGRLGVQVRNFFQMGAELKNIFRIGFGNEFSERRQLKRARPYVTSKRVGGHALDSAANTVRCAQDGYDGVIHICPTGCMPEVSVRTVLGRIAEDMNMPVLELSFDEHTSHVGITTRLEAFVEILYERCRGRVCRAGDPA